MNIGRLKRQCDIVATTVEKANGLTGDTTVPNGDINLGDTWNPAPAPKPGMSGLMATALTVLGIAAGGGIGGLMVKMLAPAAQSVIPAIVPTPATQSDLSGEGTVLKLAH